jgi:hypothetical protein
MIIGMSEKTRRADDAMMRELHGRLCALVPEYWPMGDQEEPFRSAPSQREAMTNYRPVSRIEAGRSWSPHDNVTTQCGSDWGSSPATSEWFAYNHTRQEFTIGSWGEAEGDTTPERWRGWSDEELDKLAEMLSHGGHELADLQAERRRRHEASSDGLAYKLRDMAENLSADLGPSEDDREALREAARLLECSGREKKP